MVQLKAFDKPIKEKENIFQYLMVQLKADVKLYYDDRLYNFNTSWYN